MLSRKVNRRRFLGSMGKAALAATGAAALGPGKLSAFPYISNSKIAKKVVVLGIDGMDPVLLARFVAEGAMPTFKKLIDQGYYRRLATTTPPQSPVAWSSFITGTDPGGHGIYDFVHRDPSSFTPYLSTSRTYDTQSTLDLGKWRLPIRGGRVELLRRGRPFWSFLADHDIPCTLSQLPANFPVVPDGDVRALSGMGTPDLLGTYGTYTYFTEDPVPGIEKHGSGRVINIKTIDHRVSTVLEGPVNSLRAGKPKTRIELKIQRDPWERVARINVQGHELIMNQGEWSEWLPLRFELMPLFAGVYGMVRFYLQQVHPHIKLYVTPINVDPMNPSVPICSPGGYSRELSQAVGRFYTQGFPEDTKALSHGIFSTEEFVTQTKSVLEERRAAFEHEYSRFKEGVFLFYFSSIDQNSHMLMRMMDETHPLYEPQASDEVRGALKYFYREMDGFLRQALEGAGSRSTLLALSDHGFSTFKREFHLSTWLARNGYTASDAPAKLHEGEFYKHVDWDRTKAYALGLNGLYFNVKGREPHGCVDPEDLPRLKRELAAQLAAVRDPLDGAPIVRKVYDPLEIYSGAYVGLAPDLVIGYEGGYRISDEAALGKFPKEIVGDRTDKWAADHCMDAAAVPGVLLANREITTAEPGLWDLAPTILKEFGIEKPAEMTGKVVL